MIRAGLFFGAVRRARAWKAFYTATFVAGAAVAAFLPVTLLLAGADHFMAISQEVRRAVWGLALGGGLAASFIVRKGWRSWRWRDIALEAGRSLRPSDGLLNACEFVAGGVPGAGVSAELVERCLEQIGGQVLALSTARVMRPRRWGVWSGWTLGGLGLAAGLWMFSPQGTRDALRRAWFPFGPETVRGLVSVRPGDALFPRGESVIVKVSLAGPSVSAPKLWVQSGGVRWEERPLSPAGPGEYRAVFQDLLEPLSYRVSYRGQWTPAYKLRPFRSPGFLSLRAELRPPSYTGRAPEAVENAFSLRALRGTRISLEGRLDRDVSGATAVFRDGRPVPLRLKGGSRLSFSMEADSSGEVQFFFEGEGLPAGLEGPSLRLDVADDGPPQVRVLSPAQDLLISPRERLPVVYEASDDLGLSEVQLAYSVNGGPQESALWNSFPLEGAGGPPSQVLRETVWDLGALGLKAGDTIRYFLAAADHNHLSGPGRGVSAVFSLQAASYDQEHEALEKSLGDWRGDLMSSLAEQSLVRNDLEAAPPDWPALQKRQAALRRGLGKNAGALEDLLKKMERDPLADAASAAEHRAILDNLRDLERDAMARAEGALAGLEKGAAARAMDEIVSELERMALLGEDVLKAGRMRDLLRRQEDLTETARSLAEDLAGREGSALSAADMKKWRGLMDEMSGLLRDISDKLAKMPQELPEDFVNREGVKNIRMDEVQSLLSQAQDALARGDAAQALAAARQMLEKLQEMQKTLNEAGENARGGPSWFSEGLMKEVNEGQEKIKSLVRRQEEIKDRTQALAAAALAGVAEEERKVLADMALRQEQAAAGVGRLEEELAASTDPALRGAGASRLPPLRAALGALREELAASAVRKAPTFFDEASGHLEALMKAAEAAEARAVSRGAAARELAGLRKIRESAADLLEENRRQRERLNNPPAEKDFLSETEKKAAAQAALDQDGLRQETVSLRRDLQSLARRTAVLGGGLARRLELAAEAMGEARGGLEGLRPRFAVERQEAALGHLREAQEQAQSSAQNMAGMGSASRPGQAGSARTMGAGGFSGVRTGPVRIPRVEEYKPPREFREEILKSMKERHPGHYEQIIQDYYRHLAK